MKLKKTLILLGLAAVASSALLAEIDANAAAKTHIKAMREDGSITNVLNLLISDGTFCQIHGHCWGEHMHVTLEYSPNRIGCRECKVCKLHQSQYSTEWR